ncbi:hypothetical protein pdam_00011602 [Pocillopora damicornis]|uniref:Uncharacterized protein n=1 Tax=Pocillopora damicornis TaxID=46731 RepID=A0A3M6THZ6_POCDA|nr:hypothetical protein pdam_00011602 [Pocillopora damicornis]
MKIYQQLNFVVIKRQAESLYSLIADGQYHPTSLGPSLQTRCNQEGFNADDDQGIASKARIGIISNNEWNCSSCDSRIGFGTGGAPDDSNTCGNEENWNPDNRERHIKVMRYILVQ